MLLLFARTSGGFEHKASGFPVHAVGRAFSRSCRLEESRVSSASYLGRPPSAIDLPTLRILTCTCSPVAEYPLSAQEISCNTLHLFIRSQQSFIHRHFNPCTLSTRTKARNATGMPTMNHGGHRDSSRLPERQSLATSSVLQSIFGFPLQTHSGVIDCCQ